uniref:Ig-like domain-containing protein n=1 Tax=Zosterops lateralis melanops TaxID=1220523 RepID=A0A8D2PVM7_ZOSLA
MPVEHGESSPAPLLPLSSAPPSKLPPLQPGHTQPTSLDHGLFLLSAAVTGQMTLEQHPREVSVQEGNEITFECNMRGDDMTKYYMYWYRQDPWGAPECIWRGRYTYGEGFQDGFEGSIDESKNRFTLQVLAAKPEDAATYYCGARITLEQLCSKVNQKPKR